MANTFKNYAAYLTGSYSAVYTAPAGATSVIIGLRLGNESETADAVATVRLKTGALYHDVVGRATPIPIGSALEGVMGSKLVLEAGDALEAKMGATGQVSCVVSVLEMT